MNKYNFYLKGRRAHRGTDSTLISFPLVSFGSEHLLPEQRAQAVTSLCAEADLHDLDLSFSKTTQEPEPEFEPILSRSNVRIQNKV